MATVLKQLGQLRPANTTAASIYSPAASTETIIKTIIVANVSSMKATYRIFNDDDGTTYDERTALFWDIDLPANKTDSIEVNILMDDSTGNLGVRTDINDALNFTVYGAETS